ncbi:MAG: Maf family protein [Rhizobiales bacterium]|nr:Maf family protein [Hyphomicrobiales bacterium]
MTIILASSSQIRRKIMIDAGVAFRVQSPEVDEKRLKTELAGAAPAILASELARAKATSVSARNSEALVIGADQVLEFEGKNWDKPTSEEAARQLLRMLRGRTHKLISALCCARNGEPVWESIDSASLTMRNFSEPFMDEYLAASGPTVSNSVGAYQLECRGVQLFESIDGDFFTILGLPLLPLLNFLRKDGTLAT